MTSFSDLALDPRVLAAVSEAGYTTPTPIQAQAIPHALEGRDVLGIAQTGTGKTAGFVLPMITLLQSGRARARMPRTLVLCPTRELAAQVAENFETYAKNVKLTMALLIGGVSFRDQDKLIDRGVDVLIATPGRLLDHHERGKLMLTGVQIMVVDEADRMLDMGFIPDIERIFKLTPFTRQTLFFSATMPPEITRLTQEFLHNPVRVEVARQASVVETIDQWVCRHIPSRRDRADEEKRDVLRRVIRGEGELTNGIIFCNRKRDVDVLAKSLKRHGFDAAALHGDLDQSLRTRILGGFREGELKLLVASDVAARGLDIPNVSHVFNFDVPIHSEDYVHRIGRTGRAGRSGKSITICLPHEVKYLEKIEELVARTIPVMASPLGTAAPADVEVALAPRPETKAEPERGERRRRERPRRSAVADAPAAGQGPAEVPVRAAEPRETPAWTEPQAAATRVEPRAAATRVEPREAAARAEPREAPSRREAPGRGERRGGRSGDRPIRGLGDHVPAFLLREFRIALDEASDPVADEAEETREQPAEAPRQQPAAAEPAVPPAAEAPEPAPAPEAEAGPAAAPKARAVRRRTPRRRSEAAVEAAPAA